ncbi:MULTISPECIES: hypothetical protein [Bizionia]|uniref:GIY-YIG domain-containing protein n=1 Tax=Bizionia algoritergicola TaxID=291187 RepID=A0A5D0QYE9_9FLAO|nr:MULTISPECIES: hypothetical protein [Bizionia]OBX22194.1 hypothetical protein BAA08_09630 [Bizionia sp. APA-3]TYB73234.1 hypothetical protein ES675_06105 [Bizionia algoritergicola]
MEIGSFKISGHSTKREWAVYLFIATPISENGLKKIYVGKVGDNRDGCNPVISRVGNHFSHNKIHSQIRNRIGKTEDYNYEYFYCHFGEYELNQESRIKSRQKTNELERELNRIVQKKIDTNSYELLNPYKGNHISKSKRIERSELINESEKNLLERLCEKAL